MITQERIKELIFGSLKEIKDSDLVTDDFELNDNTVLLGMGGNLDSIAFVSFITDLEEKIEDEIGHEVAIKLQEVHDLNEGKDALLVGDLVRRLTEIINKDYANKE